MHGNTAAQGDGGEIRRPFTVCTAEGRAPSDGHCWRGLFHEFFRV